MIYAIQTPANVNRPQEGKLLFFDRRAAHAAKIDQVLKHFKTLLMDYYDADPTPHDLYYQCGLFSKEKHDIVKHVRKGSEIGVYREAKDLSFKVLNEVLKSPLSVELFHISTAKKK